MPPGGKHQTTLLTLPALVYYLVRETFRPKVIQAKFQPLWLPQQCQEFARYYLQHEYEDQKDFQAFLASPR